MGPPSRGLGKWVVFFIDSWSCSSRSCISCCCSLCLQETLAQWRREAGEDRVGRLQTGPMSSGMLSSGAASSLLLGCGVRCSVVASEKSEMHSFGGAVVVERWRCGELHRCDNGWIRCFGARF
ncbi:hypothetical protein BS78_10G010100 [Paspalum vaginatum]|nr:hypothetical protein BS78_10G010100 [Paspalum vaginatum]